jgi:hypothetical protein
MASAKSVRPERADLNRLEILVYLIPVFGFFPALWTLYRQEDQGAKRNASRLAVTLALGWLAGYLLLGIGAQADAATLPLLILASLLTSGYFLANIWLMVRLWQGKSVRLPGVSQVGDRLF